ncbi:carbohydrate ABC transporter permease [Bacillus solitudinis]|uniref:carbohydrate ABC transporter permease n=1 Tax=Bacillus solitudinis TaxID=2014074 RepID=UPI000C24C01E|nr:carbohydrate ABC transporter permease [Bacillus solitudinis]
MKNKSIKIIIHVAITLILAINLLPLVIALSSSFRKVNNMTNPLKLFDEFSLESYMIAFEKMNFLQAFWNSIILTTIPVIVVVIFSAMAAYPLARINNKLSKFLFFFFICGLVVPSQMVIIPIVQTMSSLNLPSPHLPPILMFITNSIPFALFLFTGFIRSSVPIELEESAIIDGAGVFRRFWSIVFPLLIPVTVAVVITQGVWIWNDYFYNMIFISSSEYTPLPLAMLGFMGDQTNPTAWNVLFAACFLASLPLLIIFAFLQKFFISGLTVGSVKG